MLYAFTQPNRIRRILIFCYSAARHHCDDYMFGKYQFLGPGLNMKFAFWNKSTAISIQNRSR